MSHTFRELTVPSQKIKHFKQLGRYIIKDNTMPSITTQNIGRVVSPALQPQNAAIQNQRSGAEASEAAKVSQASQAQNAKSATKVQEDRKRAPHVREKRTEGSFSAQAKKAKPGRLAPEETSEKEPSKDDIDIVA